MPAILPPLQGDTKPVDYPLMVAFVASTLLHGSAILMAPRGFEPSLAAGLSGETRPTLEVRLAASPSGSSLAAASIAAEEAPNRPRTKEETLKVDQVAEGSPESAVPEPAAETMQASASAGSQTAPGDEEPLTQPKRLPQTDRDTEAPAQRAPAAPPIQASLQHPAESAKRASAELHPTRQEDLPTPSAKDPKPASKPQDSTPGAGRGDSTPRVETGRTRPPQSESRSRATRSAPRSRPIRPSSSRRLTEPPRSSDKDTASLEGGSRKGAQRRAAQPAGSATGSKQSSPSGPALLPAPAPRYSPHPEYPEQARWEERTGAATVSFRIRPDGSVHDVALVTSSGHGDLDQAALRAIARWLFKVDRAASKLNRYRYRFRFRLE